MQDTRHDKPTSLAFGPDGKTLIISDTGLHSAFVWNLAAEAVTATFPNPRNAHTYNTALSPDGRFMAESSDWAGHARATFENPATGSAKNITPNRLKA